MMRVLWMGRAPGARRKDDIMMVIQYLLERTPGGWRIGLGLDGERRRLGPRGPGAGDKRNQTTAAPIVPLARALAGLLMVRRASCYDGKHALGSTLNLAQGVCFTRGTRCGGRAEGLRPATTYHDRRRRARGRASLAGGWRRSVADRWLRRAAGADGGWSWLLRRRVRCRCRRSKAGSWKRGAVGGRGSGGMDSWRRGEDFFARGLPPPAVCTTIASSSWTVAAVVAVVVCAVYARSERDRSGTATCAREMLSFLEDLELKAKGAPDQAVTCERQRQPDPDGGGGGANGPIATFTGTAQAAAVTGTGTGPPPNSTNTIFIHDPRRANKPPCQCSPSCQCQPQQNALLHSKPLLPLEPRPAPDQASADDGQQHLHPQPKPPLFGVVYLLHATPLSSPPLSLKMPVSSESTLAVPLQPLRPPSPSLRPLSRADRARMHDHTDIPANNNPLFSFRRLKLLSLNRDVLKTISDFCAPADALQLAMTCKDAYELAMPRVLSDVSIGDPALNDGPDRLDKFCRFMLADPRRRIRHLRALRLLEGAFARVTSVGGRERLEADFSSADVLASLLRQADNLRLIHIRDAEPLFQHHPAVYEALSQLTALNEVSLYYIGNSTLKAISQLRSTPAVIENGLWKDGPRPQGDITPFGPFVDSLRHLKLWECGCMLESVIDRHIWPNLHTLEIGGRIAKISELAHAFPNLRRLTFHMEFSVKPETGPVTCWPELDYLETSAPIPSFPSPVRRLQLQYPIGSTPGPHSAADLKTLPLAERTNPVVLSCTVSDSTSGTMLERMKSSMPSLRYLELVYTDGPCGRCGVQWRAFHEWTERNVEILRTTSLVGLCIGYAGAADTSSASETRRRRYLSLARTLAKRVKSLQYIGVGTQDAEAGMYALDCAWFKVSSRPADEHATPVLETLTPAEGERVRETLQDTPRET